VSVPILYRPARADDLERADRLVVASINDLTERHGFGPMATVRTPEFQLFSLNDSPGGLWTAEEGGQIVGSAFAWACGDLWFLAELFIAPDRQGEGIGNALLGRMLEHAQACGATCKALLTFTFNRTSQALYIRHGMFPRCPVYMFGAARDALLERLPAQGLRSVPLERTEAHHALLASIDVSALGVSREKHHRFLADDATVKGFLLHDGDACAGYAYVNSFGHIGPFAVERREAIAPAFAAALRLASETSAPQISAFIPGASDAALTVAVGAGMRINFPMLLMSSCEFGDWSRYLPRNPGFM
jgi:GNAT superfamily N-acetyltransferase